MAVQAQPSRRGIILGLQAAREPLPVNSSSSARVAMQPQSPGVLPVDSLCATISLTLLPNLILSCKTTIKVPAHHPNPTWNWEMLSGNHPPIRES